MIILGSKVLSNIGDVVCTTRTGFFLRGVKTPRHDAEPVKVFEPPEDIQVGELNIVPEKTAENQAFLYRLSNDLNPLHVDPSSASGFARPILHGLCSMGIAARSLHDTYFPDDCMRLYELGVRFTGPVFPGETLEVESQPTRSNLVSFTVRVKDRESVALRGSCKFLHKPLKSKCLF